MSATITRLATPLGHDTYGIAHWYTNPLAVRATHVTFGALSADVEQALDAADNSTQSILDAVAFANLDMQLFIARRRLGPHEQVVRRLIGHNAEFPAGVGLGGHDEAPITIRALERRLRLPLRSVLKAAGIKQRTFYAWQARPNVMPRVASQGRLWALCQCLEDIEALFDGRLDWLREPERIDLLEQGRFDELVDAAFAATTRRGPTPRLLYTGDDGVVVEMPKVSGDIPVQSATRILW